MRITTKSIIDPYQRNLAEIQERRSLEELRISTGKQLHDISDEPEKLVRAKQLSTMIDQNLKQKSILDEAVAELTVVEDFLTELSDNIQEIRQLVIDASSSDNSSILYSLGVNIKGLLEDILNVANKDFNGHFLFSGTKTTDYSLNQVVPDQNNLPFELIKEAPTDDNPSGLRVIYKGNFEEREIIKDNSSKEVISTPVDEVFGSAGTELFQAVVDIYNLLTYNEAGDFREAGDDITDEDFLNLDQYQKNLADFSISIDNVTARNGARINRLDALSSQLLFENSRLKELRSQAEDTDISQSTLNLMKEETALQYALQIGSRLIPQSLFDFLG